MFILEGILVIILGVFEVMFILDFMVLRACFYVQSYFEVCLT